ncbi:MAG: zinc-dependent metalloprotease, partial [Acidobacteriota bacterium]
DRSRSVFYLPRTKTFPLNSEIETLLTFTSNQPGPLVRSVAASGEAVSLRQHHSLVKLPDDGYAPRQADPRIGAFGPTFYDYATPIDQSLAVRWVARHRLEKKNPRAARSEPVEPIVYYLDRGVPDPVRSALMEGAAWWNQAFEAAGFIDAFRVEVLPEGVDPLDLRYNVIHWTHRSTRGWSYGGTVTDPRTGEILKGNVNLGSLRLRQDYLMGQGLTPLYGGRPDACGLGAGPAFEYLAEISGETNPVEMALARVRQLSAHEVGHTLGFPHNYIASTYGRASVMDYPAPLVEIAPGGKLDLSNAYGVGIGEYDKLAVKWLYSDFPPGTDEKRALEDIVQEGLREGMRFMAHTDNAFVGAAHPLASVWDNGADLVEGLKHEIEVRRLGLERFGPEVIRPGEPMASLEKVLVPLYLHHRFQLNAAVQSLGGADYTYALSGDGQVPITIVPGDKQRETLEVVLSTLAPEFLALPERLLHMIPPPAYRMEAGETFAGHTGLTFDPLTAAAAAAQFTASSILHPERMARLAEFHSRNSEYPGLEEVLSRLVETTWKARVPSDPYVGEVQETAQRVVLDEMLKQASSSENPASVRAVLTMAVE